MIDYSAELNPEQLAAVLHGEGPCLVLAGAGSGKTRVITYRVAYLLEHGIHPQNILLVTFTNKAADEMKKRIHQIMSSIVIPAKAGIQDSSRWIPNQVGNDNHAELPWSGTFHHIAYRILRVYAPVLGYKSNFSVLDSDDSEALLKLCAKPFKSDDGRNKFPSARVLQNIISFARNSEAAIGETLDLKYPQWLVFAEQIKSIADEYYLKKKEANAMDFDDLLVNFLLLLNNEQVLQKYAEQFKYILVDEYQDTNKIQSSIIKKLSSVHNNVLVVGDDAQSIYSFRAANIAHILDFEKEYPNLPTGQAGAKIFKLETNYRSSQEILAVANDVIANNVKQYKKQLKTLSESGIKPSLHPQMDQAGEAEFVTNKILELAEKGTPESEIAVLFRAAHHSQMLEMELVKAGIAYDYRGGLRFFERAHVKDILAYLRILNNLADTAAWMRVLMHEEGIGPAAADKVVKALQRFVIPRSPEATANGNPRLGGVGPQARGGLANDSTANPPLPRPSGELHLIETEISHFIRNDIPEILGEKARGGWYNFTRIWESMLGAGKADVANLIDAVIASPYKDYLEAEFIDSRDRLEDLEQLKIFAKKYNELEQFLAEASLQESFSIRGQSLSPSAREGAGGSGSGKIVLSTIHQAKGLEWSAVFIINLSSGAFPNDRALREDNGLEEERRLFYVAITRAKKHVYLTYPMTGLGRQSFSDGGPSLFLGEISSDLIDDHSLLSMGNGLVLNDEAAGVSYEAEDKPLRIKPGSFLRSIEDL